MLIQVMFVPLATIRTPAMVAPAIAEALGLANVTAIDLAKRARVACADRRTLMVLDNFEHVIDAAPLLTTLLSSSPGVKAIVTSRRLEHVARKAQAIQAAGEQ